MRAANRRTSFVDTLVFFEERGIGGRGAAAGSDTSSSVVSSIQSVVLGRGKRVTLARSVVPQARGGGEA